MTVYCKNCNSELQEYYKFCPNCGHPNETINAELIKKLENAMDKNLFVRFKAQSLMINKFIPINVRDGNLFIAAPLEADKETIIKITKLAYPIYTLKFIDVNDYEWATLLFQCIMEKDVY